MEENRLSEDEFNFIMLLHAAHTDFKFSETEKQLLISQYGELFYKKMKQLYSSFNDLEIDMLFIKYYNQYLSAPTDRHIFFSKLKEIYNADGNFCRFEKFFDAYYKRILELAC